MVSSVDDLLDELGKNIFKLSQNSSNNTKSKKEKGKQDNFLRSNSTFRTGNIEKMLNIRPNADDQVEGNLLFDIVGGKRFLTFDKTTIECLTHYLRQNANILRNGKNFSYTKLYDQHQVTLAFPTTMGLPFVYNLKTPTLLHSVGKVSVKTHFDNDGSSNKVDGMNTTADIHFVFSTKTASKICFVTPWDHMRYIAGLERNFKFNLPVKMSFNVSTQNKRTQLQIMPLYPRHDSMLLHFSVWPYTAKHDNLVMQPASNYKSINPIKVRDSWAGDLDFGRDSVGLSFKLKYSSEAKFFDARELYNNAKQNDAVSLILCPWAEMTIEPSNFSLFFDGPKSDAHSITLTANYGKNKISLSCFKSKT